MLPQLCWTDLTNITNLCDADCVLKAVNLGHDTDTVAAVAGGLAGSLYRFDAIPQRWLDGLLHADMIYHLCDAFSSSLVNDGENIK